MITQGMLHDKRVIQKAPRAYHLVKSALGTMVNDVSLWVTSTLGSILIVTRGRVSKTLIS